jgi:hypothetical protein
VLRDILALVDGAMEMIRAKTNSLSDFEGFFCGSAIQSTVSIAFRSEDIDSARMVRMTLYAGNVRCTNQSSKYLFLHNDTVSGCV